MTPANGVTGTAISRREELSKQSRREFLQTVGAGATVFFLTQILESAAPVEAASPASPLTQEAPPVDAAQEDVIIRMQADLRRAMAKPVEQRRWAMVIDLRKCVGCSACTIACVAENKLPPGVVYRPVLDEEIGTYPHVTRRFVPRPCMQCDNPPCVPVCPVNATFKRADGIVAVNYDQCIGCRYCVTACPYAARTFDFGRTYTDETPDGVPALAGRARTDDYEHAASFEYGRARERRGAESPVGNVRKCHFCLHRLEAGMLPQCVTSCIGRATFFGDAGDPDSLVAEMIANPNVMRLKEEMGTRPRVYYLL